MRLIGFDKDGTRWIGSVENGSVTPVATVADFYRAGGAIPAPADVRPVPLAELTQVPPVPETSRIFCVGINYKAHATEAKAVAGLDEPTYPMIFGRWESTLVTDGVPVPVPPNEKGLDWEVELAAVIKDEVWAAEEETALQHVLGYTGFNDLSARRKQLETPQFTLGKNADRSGPIGPVVVTADEIPDPQDLRVTTRVNGETLQDGNTVDMIHSVAKIIAYITDTVTLLPGDVIATGTPAGVGVNLNPQRFLTPGDVVEIEVEKIGIVRTPIVSRGEI
jgi:2-keto-4-pentenoate hydratase/2-oxohepta-3-ene-1,7-dioic acid hydratase in catechol pathway